MNIVILDGHNTNPGDLSWEPIERLGKLTVYDKSEPEEIAERTKDADVVVLCRAPFGAETFAASEQLKMIATLAIGYNTIDLPAANEHGVTVSNVPFYCVDAVAQMTFSLLLELCNNVGKYSALVRSGKWADGENANHTTMPFFELSGKTMGIFGFGTIGKAVAKIASAMNMRVLVNNRTKRELPEGCEWVSREELFAQSDVLSVNCPLTDETRGIIDKALLETMKPTAFLINTARGAVINEQDLADCLNDGTIAGAGLDVMTAEPPEDNNPLLTAKNCYITPHIAWASRDSRTRLIETVASNIEAFLSGNPQNVVNSPQSK